LHRASEVVMVSLIITIQKGDFLVHREEDQEQAILVACYGSKLPVIQEPACHESLKGAKLRLGKNVWN